VTSGSPRLISVVLPVHNQAAHIGAIIASYRDVLEQLGQPYEVVLSVNGSRDDSVAVCEQMARSDSHIRVIADARAGWGLAVKAGLRAARGDLLCYTNCARTSAADLQQLLLTALDQPNVVIKATRRVRDNWKRRLGSAVYNAECRVLFGVKTGDVNATPKVFSRAAHAALLNLTSDGDLLDAEFMFACRRHRYPLIEVPIFGNRRQGGSSTTGYKSAVGMYVGAYRLWRSTRGRIE
jgi:glycosyltransferase involved in cell wall biosynthesis